VRLGVVSTIMSPGLLRTLLPILASGFLAGLLALLYLWRRDTTADQVPMPDIKNPTELRVAFGFAAAFTVVVLLSAWLSDIAGQRGLYALAFISGLTDVDAIALSAMRLFNLEQLQAKQAATAIIIAVFSNIAFKLGMVFVVGGAVLFRRCVVAMGAVATGLIVALVVI